jgi:glycerate kinase
VRVVIAPDSFKGTITATAAARALARGWLERRPTDHVGELPLADGGEGTLDAFVAASRGAKRRTTQVCGPDDRPVQARWLQLDDGTGVTELAQSSGLPLMRRLDPMGAHTFGFGQTIAAAVDSGCTSVVAALGGSASTDGGTGALRALGVRFLDRRGEELPLGGEHLARLHAVDDGAVLPPPRAGVSLFADVTAPLLGPSGAAATFGPQKGASAEQVALLEQGLGRLAEVIGGVPDQPGAGAAGGTAFGLVTLWSARVVPGATAISRLVGLPDQLAAADVVITGEGRFDATSFAGKVVGEVLAQATKVGTSGRPRVCVVAGEVAPLDHDGYDVVSLSDLAGSAQAARADPARWLRAAGSRLAEHAAAGR